MLFRCTINVSNIIYFDVPCPWVLFSFALLCSPLLILPSLALKVFVFKDYKPRVFYRIRKLFNVDSQVRSLPIQICALCLIPRTRKIALSFSLSHSLSLSLSLSLSRPVLTCSLVLYNFIMKRRQRRNRRQRRQRRLPTTPQRVQDYLGSLQEQVKESFSEGKSGAFLYFTSDGRYIVKTVTRSERTVILKIADNMLSYFEGEVGAGRKSFIATPFGFHSIRMYRTKIYFLVQENVLRVPAGVDKV